MHHQNIPGNCWTEALGARREALLDPRAVHLARALVEKGLVGEGTVDVPDHSHRTLTRSFRSRGLPCPWDWLAFGRCLRTIRWLQSRKDSVWRSALETGWEEPASFFRACKRLFQDSPRQLDRITEADLMHRMISLRSASGKAPAPDESRLTSSSGRFGH